jgi:8-oxo-dGTP pyrophosphatase MutT (NUDIX family)
VKKTSWDEVRFALASRSPLRVKDVVSARAAVAVVLREGPAGFEILFIRRAEAEGDPWSGHMGFPGGRAEKDEELGATAMRETLEETGIDLAAHGEPLGALDEVRAMARMQALDLAITPFVFRFQGPAEFLPNPEVASLHWLPFDELRGPAHESTMEYVHQGVTARFPCLRYDGLVIWGLTYRMFTSFRELLDQAAAGLAFAR